MYVLMLPWACASWAVATAGTAWWVGIHVVTGGFR